jgi:GT2 family glycosyltransferase
MNAGMREALSRGADAVLLLTHDVILEERCVELLTDELERNHQAGVVAPVLGWRGRVDTTWSAGGTIGWLTGTPHHPEKGLPLASVQRRHTRSVAWADGAVLLVRREVLDLVGMLPEHYFLYFEEVDFQARVRRSGRTVEVVSGALAWQTPGHTPRYLAARNQLLWLRSGRRAAIPFFLATVGWACAREVVRRAVGRAPDLALVRALLAGVADGVSGRLRSEYLARA